MATIRGGSILERLSGTVNDNSNNFSRTIEKIASGNRLAAAGEDPASLVSAEVLKSDIAGLTQAIRNTETDITLVQTAEDAVAEVTALLKYLKQSALDSANTATSDAIKRSQNQYEVDLIKESIDRIVSETTFGNKPLLDGSAGASGAAVGRYLEFVSGSVNSKDTPPEGLKVEIENRGTQSYFIGKDVIDASKILPGSTITAIEGGKEAQYSIRVNDSLGTVKNNFQNAIDVAGLNLIVDTNPANRLLIYHREYGSKPSFAVSSSVEGVLSDDAGEVLLSTPGSDVKGTVNGVELKGEGQYLKGIDGTKTEGIVLKYNYDLKDLSDNSPESTDGGTYFVKQNSLYFQTYPDYMGGFNISIDNIHSSQLGVSAQNSRFRNLAEIDVSTLENASESLKVIQAAENETLGLRSKLGAAQKQGLEGNLNHLLTMRENITAAASIITDADYAEEVANAIKYQLNTAYASWSFQESIKLQENLRKIISLDNNTNSSTIG